MRAGVPPIGLALFAVLIACGGDSSQDQACQTLAKARCSQLQTCSAADLRRRWGDLDTCEAREKLSCTESLAVSDTAATPATIDGCASAVSADGCAEFLAIPPPPACLPPAGPRAAGSPCAFNAQCSTSFCSIALTALCGTCMPPPAAGASCVSNGCGPNMNCVVATMQCQIPVQLNGACDKTLPCDHGLSCVGVMTGVMGTCMMAGELTGATCDPARHSGADCDPDYGLSCDTTMRTCIAEPIAPAGGNCGAVGTAFTRCTDGGTCVMAMGATTGVCVAPAADGGACDSVNGPFCFFPARCVPNTPGGTVGVCKMPGSQSC